VDSKIRLHSPYSIKESSQPAQPSEKQDRGRADIGTSLSTTLLLISCAPGSDLGGCLGIV
jgi:hypothetical protein